MPVKVIMPVVGLGNSVNGIVSMAGLSRVPLALKAGRAIN